MSDLDHFYNEILPEATGTSAFVAVSSLKNPNEFMQKLRERGFCASLVQGAIMVSW